MAENDPFLEKAIAGDREALGKLLMLETAALRPMLARRIDCRRYPLLQADDVLQTACQEVQLGIGGFTPAGPGSFGRWFRKVVDTTLRDEIRRMNRKKRPRGQAASLNGDSGTALLDLLRSGTPTPSRCAASSEWRQIVGATLREIGHKHPKYEAAIRMYDLEEWSAAEAAAELKMSVGVFHMTRWRGLRELQEHLGSPTKFFTHAGRHVKNAPTRVSEAADARQR
jgi:RNA polymerase sigma factor (sigma-70 family)